jgi:glycosyltransferase involved in cell wall biosynthesis
MDQFQVLDKDLNYVLPLVSVVSPVLNGAKWITNCIESVIAQNYPKIEHIIVDGGSSDDTINICKKYKHLIIHSEKDRGQSHAINKGFSLANGEILGWLCADDEFEPNSIDKAVKAIMSGYSVVMGNSTFIDENGSLITEHPSNKYPYYSHAMFVRFWKYNPISQPGTFWTRKIWETCGPVREDLFFAMDYDLWLRMSLYTFFAHLDTNIGRYRIHPEAKCFSDNYGSRVELIKVSRQYWPPKFKIGYWKLLLSYRFSTGSITQHYSDGIKHLEKTLVALRSSKKQALKHFVLAHFNHPATPFLPNYFKVLKNLLTALIGFSFIKN